MQLSDNIFHCHKPLEETGERHTVKIIPLTAESCASRLAPDMEEAGFCGKPGQTFVRNELNKPAEIYVGVNDPLRIYDLASASQKAAQIIDRHKMDNYAFAFEESGLSPEDGVKAVTGWYLGCYSFGAYKTEAAPEIPALLWPADTDRSRVEAFLEAVYLLRNLINTPANHLGPEELGQIAAEFSDRHGCAIHITGDLEILQEFPLVHAVGDSSPRRPLVIDMRHGNPEHPHLTIIGKGVCFDTGGLDLKPHSAMEMMKKDMGGAAHALGLALLIIKTGLPVYLRVIIPAVENSVSGRAFRLGDVFTSRKGITVENGNTDAEGRLVLADCMTLASEENPELIIDFATLTGSARAGLGYEIPALFSNRAASLDELRDISMACNDPVWPLPLWEGYRKDIDGQVADIANVAKTRGDAIHAALFLREFIHGEPEWIHLDMYAWEQNGRPGRPKGGTDTGLRAIFELLEKRYSQ
jgi:leucyl aminopeptidase